jgi:beta-mannosidase
VKKRDYLNIWKIAECADLTEVEKTLEAVFRGEPMEGFIIEGPVDVCTALVRHGLIADPYYSTNSTRLRWIEKRYWIYLTEFDKPGGGSTRELCFHGLDTFCDIYLNGSPLGRGDNMFRTYRFDVTPLLKEKNALVLVFHPHELVCRDFSYERMSVYSFDRQRAFIRKSAFSFGWDWAPRLITAGLCAPVYVESFAGNRLREIYTWTESIGKDRAVQGFKIALERTAKARLTMQFFHRGVPLKAELSEAGLRGGGYGGFETNGREYRFSLRIDEPALWWPWEMGKPELHPVEIALYEGEERMDEIRLEVGLRILELDTGRDATGSKFQFRVNHVPMFCRGANWVPADCLLSDIPPQRYRRLLERARQANMNMLRVWGGGIYETDRFYDQADRLGLLIWQDFMFTSSHYPDYSDEFVESVRAEAQDNILRLRNHPSLVLWCGNNECQWLHSLKVSEIDDETFYGKLIFHEVLPELLRKLDPARPYWPGSPWGGENPNSPLEGDRHSWQVYGGIRHEDFYGAPYIIDRDPEAVTFQNYANERGRFISEFGLAAAPVLQTLDRNIPADQLRLGSFELSYRNQDISSRGLECTVAHYCGEAEDLRRFIQFSMLCQAEGLRFGVEHFRRNKEQTSGALLWQLNDCWPGISLSLVDYYLIPKASWYYARRFFDPVLYSARILDRGFEVWICNDRIVEIDDTLNIRIGTFYGEEVLQESLSVRAQPRSSCCLGRFPDHREHHLSRSRWTYLSLSSERGFAAGEYFFLEHKLLRFPEAKIRRSVNRQDGGFSLSVSSDCFVRFVHFQSSRADMLPSDNYFNLLPGQQRVISISTEGGEEIDAAALTIDALNMARPELLLEEE